MRRSVVAYGAFELKYAYQVHMGWGITIGALLHVAAIVSIPYLVRPDAVVAAPTIPWFDDKSVFKPLLRLEKFAPTVVSSANPPIPEIAGIPIPAPDEEIVYEYVPPRWDELPVGLDGTEMNGAGGIGSEGVPGVAGSGIDGSGGMPAPDVFVAVEFQPVLIKKVAPEFPEMARLTGREGKVVVRALVDQEGVVRIAEIVRSSGANVGFDEAAIEAALLCIYKPAIQNGMPVMVWVTYMVEFKMK